MEGLQVFTTAALVTFALYTGQNLIRYLRAADWNGVLGILLSWVLGVGLIEWMANSAVTSKLEMVSGAGPIGNMDFGSLALLGLAFGSAAPVLADFFKAKDDSRTSRKPTLVRKSYPQDDMGEAA